MSFSMKRVLATTARGVGPNPKHHLKLEASGKILSPSKSSVFVLKQFSKSCNMSFQRVVEIEEVEETTEVPRASDRQSQPHKAVRRPTSPIIGPAYFQRVRLMSKQALPRNLDTQAEYELERARKEVDENPEEAQPKPALEQLTDPSSAEFLQYTVRSSDGLTDPATEAMLRQATSSPVRWNSL